MNTKSGKTIWIAIGAFVSILCLIFSLQNNSANAGLKDEKKASFDEASTKNGVPVKLSPVTRRKFLKTINVYGKVESYQSTFVSPKIAGIVEKLHVDEGARVEKGKTVLFEIDNLKLQQKVDNARQNISIVLAVEKERKALLRKAEIDLKKKSSSFARYKSLFDKNAVTKETFDAQEADFLSASAEVELKKAVLELGQAEAKQAVINLQMTERDLADSIILAPINGYVSEKLIEIGEMAQPGKPALKIDNTTKLLISAYIPAEYNSSITQEKTEAELTVNGEPLATKLKVTYVSPVIDPKMHIFEIKSLIEENSFNLKPGQSVQLKLFIDEHSTITVPTASLIENNNECAVFTCENSIAKRIVVTKGDEFEGWTEILNPELIVGSTVISEGQFLINDSSPVAVIE
ncbi:MAG: efflux RND transporter periplasmic adaptor subunit [Candidatus Riflebacteria bacterium]|nr:efflux RND transporter periplasmic adaptor subunit [Candidatus Riflebacteria bacterium]